MSATVHALFLAGNTFVLGLLASVIFIIEGTALRLLLGTLFIGTAINCVRNFLALVPA